MPQLNPAPWCIYFMLTWVTFLVLVMLTTVTNVVNTFPTYNQKKGYNTEWSWPWT